TAALRANDSYVVHGLDADAANVRRAREHVRSLGLYGKVSVDRLDGKRLPYVENLVNLVVAEDPGGVPMAELMRVLCPNGVACVRERGKWTKTVKPRPREIDEWTHYMHDAGGNAVAHDSVVGPPRRYQWVGSPRWSRHHDHMSSVSAVVSTGGRVFYIFDEGPRASILLPPKWHVIARDAFNGTILWKRAMGKWHTHMWRLKSGPAKLPRRLVAVGDVVYVTLAIDAPLTALDAATGKTLRTYEGTKATEEVIASEGVLFLSVDRSPTDVPPPTPTARGAGAQRKTPSANWGPGDRLVLALASETGQALWNRQTRLSPLTLSADAEHVYFHDGEKVVCLNRGDGKEVWTSKPLPVRESMPSYFAPTLLVYQDVVLYAGGEKLIPHRGGKDMMTALSAKTGRTLWTAEHPPSGYQSPEDTFVAGGLVWTGSTTSGGYDGVFTGRDVYTGEVKVQFAPDVESYWFHHRCHRGKATDKYLLTSRTGIEFIDIRKKQWLIHHWVRGACLYGVMPCNGLIYAPPHPCACYPEAKLNGFSVLAPQGAGPRISKDAAQAPRLERGPAYGKVNPQSAIRNPQSDDWPTYRHDAMRSGRTGTAVPTDLKSAWQVDLGGRLSSAVIADGKVFVAQVDAHAVHALDAASGKRLWSYTAGGRVDSPPTIHQGRVLFGSADGRVYCLRAADGELIWRFRAAPADERLMAWEQVESVWPVHGSVLVQDDVACFVAGRSMFLDGGLRLHRLDAKTGRQISETVLDDLDPNTGKSLQERIQVLNMPVALPDILSSDGRHLYMKSQVFDMKGKRLDLGPHSGQPAEQGSVQGGETAHVFCPSGFLDDSWWHRTYWVYGRSFAGGHAGYYQAGKFTPSGRILTFDDANVYAFGREPQYYKWTAPLEHHLFAASREAPGVEKLVPKAAARRGAAGSMISFENTESLNPAGKAVAVEAWVRPAKKAAGVILARGGPTHGYALLLKAGRPQFAVRVKEQVFAVTATQRVAGEW
ncbi:MAG: PQQ-binding-like beta-propeller repeat protein, partial [Phycisphaerae bacterium]